MHSILCFNFTLCQNSIVFQTPTDGVRNLRFSANYYDFPKRRSYYVITTLVAQNLHINKSDAYK